MSECMDKNLLSYHIFVQHIQSIINNSLIISNKTLKKNEDPLIHNLS